MLYQALLVIPCPDATFTLPFLQLFLQDGLVNLVIERRSQAIFDGTVFSGELGVGFGSLGHVWSRCNSAAEDDEVCLEWKQIARLQVEYDKNNFNAQCYKFTWHSLDRDLAPMDHLHMGSAHWYGGAQIGQQRWPLNKRKMKIQPFIGQNYGNNLQMYGSVLQRYWVSSNGVAISVPDDVPLHVGNDHEQFYFKGDYADTLYPNPRGTIPKLVYMVCIHDNVHSIHKYMSKRLWTRAQGTPDEDLFRYPIWSTWGQDKMYVDQEEVLYYVDKIYEHGFAVSQIEITGMYTPMHSDFVFGPKFPDLRYMTDKIHALGYKVACWIIPFADLEAEAYTVGKQHGYWVKQSSGDKPVLVNWWQSRGALLDITNIHAIKWFFRSLKVLKKAGIDSFSFDAGEVNYLTPNTYKTYLSLTYPDQFSTVYVKFMAANSNSRVEVRVGYKTQHVPIMVRMYDRKPVWDYDSGLKTLIPTALQFSIIGYSFIVADMIGGNCYSQDGQMSEGVLPDKELFIRWLQLTAFMPAMHFCIPPWYYDYETVYLALKYARLHESYVFPKVIMLGRESTRTGDPIIRPMWWKAPYDMHTFDIEDQFMIGNTVLVAPILNRGQTHRDVYLPSGTWQDMLRGDMLSGQQMLYNYRIELEEIAYFEEVSSKI